MKTIAIFSGFASPHLGGVERYTENIAKKLEEFGYKVFIVTTNSHHLKSFEVIGNISYFRLPSKKIFKQRYPILDKNQEYYDLLVMLDQEKIDFIICNTRFYVTSLLGVSIAKKKNVPSIVIEHGGGYLEIGKNIIGHQILDFFGHIYEHIITSLVKRKTSDFYAVSKRSMSWLKTFNITAKGTVYNSISSTLYQEFKSKEYLPKSNGEMFISFAGRIIEEKGIILLLEAFSRLNADNTKLIIAGEGPILENLKAKYESPSIIFLGKLNYEETMSLMSQSDIFVNPSIYAEGMPTAVLESGVLKNAVVATDRGGVTEIITDDSLGVIVEDNTESIYKALKNLVENDAIRYGLQEKIHQRVQEHFTWDVTVKKLIQEVIEQ